jgi:hypothetical protein
VTKDSAGDVYLAAFAGGTTNLLGSALTAGQAAETQMIVLQLNVTGGNDTLTAWVLGQGATNLTGAVNVSGFDVGSLTNLTSFTLQSVAGTAGGTNILSGVYMDEFRFGTTLADVTTAIPEPATISMLVLGALVTGLIRWQRCP